MQLLDTSNNPRIPVLLDLLSALNRLTDPAAILDQFVSTMRRAYGAHCYLQISTTGLPPGHYRLLRAMAPDGSEHCQPGDDSVHTGGFIGRIVSTPGPKAAQNLDLSHDEALGDLLAPYHSAAAVPVVDNPFNINWVMLLDPDPHRMGATDLEEMILRTALMGAVINNLQIARQLEKANRHIQSEIEQIARIQRTLLPDPVPQIPGLSIAASYHTFERAGGDYYDFVQLRDGRWLLLIADASGHGPAAAVVMAMLHAILHATSHSTPSPAALMQHLNRQLCAKRIESSFVTAFLAFYDPAAPSLTYTRAGHPPPLLRHADPADRFTQLSNAGGIPLGIDPDFDYLEQTLPLSPGDTLVLYTDGISEAVSPSREMFDIPGIQSALRDCPPDPHAAVEAIGRAVSSHQRNLRPGDDQTVVALRVMESAMPLK